MKTKFIITSIIILSFLGCSKETTDIITKRDIQKEHIPIETALGYLNDFLAESQRLTKGQVKEKTIFQIEAFGKKELGIETKSISEDIPDSLVYIVNFKDGEGFALLSATERLPERIYAITDSGNLHAEDLSRAHRLLQSVGTKADGDSTQVNLGEDIVPALLVSATINGITDPWILDPGDDGPGGGGGSPTQNIWFGPHVQTKWCQSSPFNNETPNNAAAGCVAIATAQIMVANRLSNTMSFNGKTCYWDDLESVFNYSAPFNAGTTDAQSQVANFVYEIGKPNNCYVRYDNNSWAMADGAKRTLENYGYTSVTKYTGFNNTNKSRAITMLLYGKPVYLGGQPSGTIFDGHAWLLDGYCLFVTGDPSLQGEYFHINWGWHGAMDGYFNCGVFDATDRVFWDSVIDANTYGMTTSGNYDYTWTYRMITYDLP